MFLSCIYQGIFVFVNHSILTFCLVQNTWKLYYNLLFVFIPFKIHQHHSLHVTGWKPVLHLPSIQMKTHHFPPKTHRTNKSPSEMQGGNLTEDLNVLLSFYNLLLCTLECNILQEVNLLKVVTQTPQFLLLVSTLRTVEQKRLEQNRIGLEYNRIEQNRIEHGLKFILWYTWGQIIIRKKSPACHIHIISICDKCSVLCSLEQASVFITKLKHNM